jgi:hypothetical protein
MRIPSTPPNVADQLSQSWKMLAGNEITILATDKPSLSINDAEHYLIMLANSSCESHAVVVHVAKADLVTLAASMFDMPSTEIDGVHTADVGREICNVFGSYCAKLIEGDRQVEIGIPKQIQKSEVDVMAANGSVLFEFAATTQSGSPAICVIRHP